MNINTCTKLQLLLGECSSAFLRGSFELLAVLACDEDHPSVRNSLILLPDPYCVEGGLGRACTVPCDEDHALVRNSLILLPDPDSVGGGLGRACTEPELPAGKVCRTRFLA